MPEIRHIDPAWLPDASQASMDFLESSFFKGKDPKPRLPAPDEFRALSPTYRTHPKPVPVKFGDLDLVVKFGRYVSVSGALCLWAIKKLFGDEIPVPEVYAWRVDGPDVFIYMQLICGEPLIDRWDCLGDEDKTAVCAQLHEILVSLRRVEQVPGDTFIGSINRQALLDNVFQRMPPGGPFDSIKHFNDWFSSLYWRDLPVPEGFEDPWRNFLPDTGSIKLTHGDLHRGNIMVSSRNPPQVIAVIDWAHAGWYPDYWEYCKAAYTSYYGGKWRNEWIPKFLNPRVDVHEVFADYVMAMGAV